MEGKKEIDGVTWLLRSLIGGLAGVLVLCVFAYIHSIDLRVVGIELIKDAQAERIAVVETTLNVNLHNINKALDEIKENIKDLTEFKEKK